MNATPRHLQKRLDAALRALTQIECIANASLEKHEGNSDLHWIIDGIGDLAHYALEVAGDPPTADELHDVEPMPEEPAFSALAETADDVEPGDESNRRNH
jgi:hypothetical protein